MRKWRLFVDYGRASHRRPGQAPTPSFSPGSPLPGLFGFQHLQRTDGDRRRKRVNPLGPTQGAQYLYQRFDRCPFAGFQIFDDIQSNAGLLGKPTLIHILPEPKVTQLPAKCRFPFFGGHDVCH
jgi:hypothetical protein